MRKRGGRKRAMGTRTPMLIPMVVGHWTLYRINSPIAASSDDIVRHCCDAWRKVQQQPGASCLSVAENVPVSFNH